MNIQLKYLTLGNIMDVEKCIYNSDFEFTDAQFRTFVDQQLEFGVDPIELELQEEIVFIYDVIYYFEDLIAKGEYVQN